MTFSTLPEAADFAGPTHLPLSTVAQLFPASTERPVFFGVKATIVMPIETKFYGMREFAVVDPDGHTLTFAERVG